MLRPLPLLLLLALAAACSGGGPAATPTTGPTPGPTLLPTLDPASLPPCKYPDRVDMPAWFPEDLPFPPGTYAAERLSGIQGYHRVLLVVQSSLPELQEFALERLPQEGWVVGRGDSEPGEVDLQFSRPPAVGAFRALDQFCRPGFVLVLVIYTPDREAIEAPVPITPNPSASPLN